MGGLSEYSSSLFADWLFRGVDPPSPPSTIGLRFDGELSTETLDTPDGWQTETTPNGDVVASNAVDVVSGTSGSTKNPISQVSVFDRHPAQSSSNVIWRRYFDFGDEIEVGIYERAAFRAGALRFQLGGEPGGTIMTDLTTYTQDNIMEWSFLGSNMPSAHSNVYVALHDSDPTNDGDQNELTGGGYSREQVDANTTEWTLSTSGDASTIENENEITFGVATEDWGSVTHFSVWDGPDSGDNALWASSLDTSRTIQEDDELRFLPGALEALIE